MSLRSVVCALLAVCFVFLAGCGPSETTPEVDMSLVQGSRIEDEPAVEDNPSPEAEPEPVAEVVEASESPVLDAVVASDEPEFLELGFDKLASFTYEIPEDEYSLNKPEKTEEATDEPDKIPPGIRALNNRKVALSGFMLPLKVDGGLVTEMLILRDQSMCCFGKEPEINEWVNVRMGENGVAPALDQVVVVYGELKVGEVRDSGFLISIYEMEGEKMETPEAALYLN